MRLIVGLFFLLLSLTVADAAARFAVCTVVCTWDTITTMWSTTSGGATGASAPGAADTATFDTATCVGGVTCTITVNTTVNITTLTIGACTASTTGCVLDFSANDNAVTLANFSGTGTGTRTLNMGDGTWTLTGTTTAWNMATTTNLTFAANSSSIVLTGATAAAPVGFTGGGLTYNNVSFTANNAVSITGANTFAALAVTGPNMLTWPSSVTNTISTAYTMTGTPSAPIGFFTSTVSLQSTISVPSGTATVAWGAFHGMVFTGGATFTASDSLNYGWNSGISISAPTGGGGAATGHIIGSGN